MQHDDNDFVFAISKEEVGVGRKTRKDIWVFWERKKYFFEIY